MHAPLQAWYDKWREAHEGTDLIYVPKNSRDEVSLPQLHFVRDYLAGLFWADVPYDQRPQEEPPRKDCKVSAFVVGEHTSKSVQLPVYSLERPDLGLRFVLRNNYHDWNVSVISETNITTDLAGFVTDFGEGDRQKMPNGYERGRFWGYCFFQGFPEDCWFGPYRENQRKFSLYMSSDYALYTFLWLILRDRRRV